MNYDKLLESVKIHEGFRDTVYRDTLNKRTVGLDPSAWRTTGKTVKNMTRNI